MVIGFVTGDRISPPAILTFICYCVADQILMQSINEKKSLINNILPHFQEQVTNFVDHH